MKTTTKAQYIFDLIKEDFLKHGSNMNTIGTMYSNGAPINILFVIIVKMV